MKTAVCDKAGKDGCPPGVGWNKTEKRKREHTSDPHRKRWNGSIEKPIPVGQGLAKPGSLSALRNILIFDLDGSLIFRILATKNIATKFFVALNFATKNFATKKFATNKFATKNFTTKKFATKNFAAVLDSQGPNWNTFIFKSIHVITLYP